MSLRNNLGLQLVALDARHFEVDFVTWWLVVWGWWLIPGGARTSVRRTDSGASASLWANTSDLTEVLFQLHERTSQVFIVSPWFIIFQIIPKARLCGSRTLWTARSPSCCSRVQDAYLWCSVSFAYGQKIQKVENEEIRFFAISSSKLARNWFCKKHLVRNHIFSQLLLYFCSLIFIDSEVDFAQICHEKSVKKFHFQHQHKGPKHNFWSLNLFSYVNSSQKVSKFISQTIFTKLWMLFFIV